MGKRKNYRFPQGINTVDRYQFPHRRRSPDQSPTNYVVDLFGADEMRSHTDILGSYTGVPMDGREQPIQDVDDL